MYGEDGLHVGSVEEGGDGLPEDGEGHDTHRGVVEDVTHGDGAPVLAAPQHQPTEDTGYQGYGIEHGRGP